MLSINNGMPYAVGFTPLYQRIALSLISRDILTECSTKANTHFSNMDIRKCKSSIANDISRWRLTPLCRRQ